MINSSDILNPRIQIVDDLEVNVIQLHLKATHEQRLQNRITNSNNEESNLADADLEMETKPEDVPAETKRLKRSADSVPRDSRKLG